MLLPDSETIAVSVRIEDETERDRLKGLLATMREHKGQHGYIVRTNAENINEFALSADMSYLEKIWESIKEKPDVIIFEGWCVGAKPVSASSLKKSINSMEKVKDSQLVWRKYVNQQLKSKYKNLYSQLNCLIYLKAKNFSLLQKWRLKQEHKLSLKNKKRDKNKIMNKEDVLNFMQTYQRITENMFKTMPKFASIVMHLNSNHQIKSTVYKNK